MSRQRGWKAINLDMPDVIPQFEFISHDDFIRKRAGVDTRIPEQRPMAWPAVYAALDFDFAWNTTEYPLARGRCTTLGHAEWSEVDPKDTRVHCPFKSVDDVLDFDPVEEYGIPPHHALVEHFEASLKQHDQWYPNAVITGGRYNSLFSACIRAFGWEMFMWAARYDAHRFAKVLDGFAEITMAEIAAWLDTDMQVFLMHDDIVWTSGAVFAPEWYRAYIFPKYERFWSALRDANRKVIFCSDGDWTAFIDDIAQAGADGFIFEPTTSLDLIVSRYGQSHVIMGNGDCRVLQYGARDDIRREVKRCVDLGRDCPGYFMIVSNHIPNGIPIDNIEYYLDTFNELRVR